MTNTATTKVALRKTDALTYALWYLQHNLGCYLPKGFDISYLVPQLQPAKLIGVKLSFLDDAELVIQFASKVRNTSVRLILGSLVVALDSLDFLELGMAGLFRREHLVLLDSLSACPSYDWAGFSRINDATKWRRWLRNLAICEDFDSFADPDLSRIGKYALSFASTSFSEIFRTIRDEYCEALLVKFVLRSIHRGVYPWAADSAYRFRD